MERSEAQADFGVLQYRLKILLPKQYEGRYDEVPPSSMSSTGLRYGPDGRVAWNTIWQSFCDLAMAGGPPHRGTLLEAGSRDEVEREPERYKQVLSEICRAVTLVSGLWIEPSPFPGWAQMYCTSAGMSGWLTRALVTENISATSRGLTLYVPAGPHYRVEKEIKNVATAVAKSCHYWMEHTSVDQQWEVARVLAEMDRESPLLQPPLLDQTSPLQQQQTLNNSVAAALYEQICVRRSEEQRAGWLGLQYPSVSAAVWMMRTLVVSNVLARREGERVLVPVNPIIDPDGHRLVERVVRVHAFAVERGVL